MLRVRALFPLVPARVDSRRSNAGKCGTHSSTNRCKGMTSSNAKTQSRQDAKGNSPSALAALRLCVSALSRAAWLAAAFCLLVGGYMLYQHALASERDPWKSPQLLALKEKL